ncbi:MAG: zinc ribbon domain-containing protein [Chromatiales bacterium]|nr:zinc ribbon domain-containing protein [Chromatiales bacterium]
MYATCPVCGHRRKRPEEPATTCPACGLVFEKWLRRQLREANPEPEPEPREAGLVGGHAGALVAHVLACARHVEPRVNPVVWLGRVAVWVGLLVWGAWFASTDHRELVAGLPEVNGSFMHAVNLAFHEAGHILFSLLGDFMGVLGGSLLQLLMPLIVAGTFVLRHGNPFGGSVGLWWAGQSAVDLAPYVADARSQSMILLGGVLGRERPGYHDWNNLLGRLDLLGLDHTLGFLTHWGGVLTMALALLWGAWLLRAQFHNLDRRF